MSHTNNINSFDKIQLSGQILAWKYNLLRRENSFPNWLVEKSILFFFISMFACWLAFGYVPKYDLIFTAAISVVLFFFVGRYMSMRYSLVGEKKFLRSIFSIGLVLRVLWMLYMFFVFNPRYYQSRHGDGADTDWFMGFGKYLSEWIAGDSMYSLSQIIDINMSAIDDVAYPMILGIEYFLTGGVSDVFVPFIVKSILGAYCAVCIYNIAKRHFGEGTARIAAILVCLNPNIIYWSGTMMKETEMMFFCCMAVDNFDKVLCSGNKLTLRAMWPGVLYGIVLMFMRMTLGLALFFSVFAHIIFASTKVISIGKKIFLGLLITSLLFVSVGDTLIQQSRNYIEKAQSDYQSTNMEWRSRRVGGNSFAKYATASIFAPLIFTIPFPTFNTAHEGQLLQIQLSGGYFIKNILSFFVIIVLLQFLITGKWRMHVFILGYTCAYLVVLVFSGFAQSGRFHMPIWPMLMLFAAYGLQMAKINKQMRTWFNYVLYGEILVCLAWNWFKLAGRGMV